MLDVHIRSRLTSLVLASVFSVLAACGGGTTTTQPDGGPGPQVPDGSTPPPDASVPLVCGDGFRTGEEVCDDGNATGGDGCSADCESVEPGWICEAPGLACFREGVCGDGYLDQDERCDDKNTASGDGCSAQCEVESGWVCPAGAGRCRAAECGDGIIAGIEQCEDGNATAGDGCGETCQLESGYKCPTPGSPCQPTTCGDRVVEGTEQCDDGNNDMGDGCSPLCTHEPRCTNGQCQAVCGDGVILPNDTSEECDDGNQRDNDGCSSACLLEDGFQCELIEQAPPETTEIAVVYRDFRGVDIPNGHRDFENKNGAETGLVAARLGADGKPVYAKAGVTSSTTHGKAEFDQWYRDTPDVNKTVVSKLTLQRQTNGAYVYDNQSFFPLDNAGWVVEGKEPRRREGTNGPMRNFSFTSEARYWFEYKGTEVLTFLGDDDVWVFINGHLAVDLGGVHSAMTGSITLSSRAADFGLQVGGIYEAVVFQAERHTTRSSYKLTLTNFLTSRTECRSTCGDGLVQEPEECDDGVNDGGYGQCARGCVWAPRCGDGTLDDTHGERCDDGNTLDGDGCSPTCQPIIN